MLKIPVTMAHGIDALNPDPWLNLTKPHFNDLMRTAHEMGFESINYDQLDAWRKGTGSLPQRPILIDFDHPMKSMRYEVHDVLATYGYRANLFVNTGMLDKIHSELYPPDSKLQIMTWDELRQLRDLGWHIGSHTVTHPSLSRLGVEDPSGLRVRRELEECDARLQKELGITSRDFAFTGTSWSKVAEDEVARRYRFGRLWIINSEYDADGKKIRFAKLAGMEDLPDEPDGGPPMPSRYITRNTHAYRLPSVEIQSSLIATVELFRKYLEGAAVMSFAETAHGLKCGDCSRLAPLFAEPASLNRRCAIVEWCEAGLFANEPAALHEAFACACFNGANNAVDYLLNKGVDPAKSTGTGMSGFHWAANRGHLDTVQLLIKRKAPLEQINMYGGTVLGCAVWSAIHEPRPGQLKIIEALILAGEPRCRAVANGKRRS